MKKTAIIISAALAILLVYTLTFLSTESELPAPANKLKTIFTFHKAAIGESSAINTTAPPATSSLTDQEVSPQFQDWYASESELVETTTANPQAKELELKSRALVLSSKEIDFLSQTVTSPNAPPKRKIFAVYLLSLAPEITNSGLQAVVNAPLQYAGQHPAHSPEETLAVQEKTLRRMALEALLERAKNDPQFRESFSKSTGEISDRSIREYADQVLANIK